MARPLMFRVSGTVILTIWWQILFMAVWTSAIISVHLYVDGMRMEFPQTLIPVLGVVTGLLLVFRTNTAYDRYWEGRKTWSTMTLAIRSLTRSIWVMVEEGSSKDVVEKVSAINLLLAFAYATKHYLREKYAYDEEDLKELISHMPKFSTPSSNVPLELQEDQEVDQEGGDEKLHNPSSTATSKVDLSQHTNKGGKVYVTTAYDVATPTNIPIELTYYVASYIKHVKTKVDASTLTLMNNALNSLVDCLTSFERILRTPIPLAYSVHLHHAVWLYLLALLVGQLGWFTLPAVTLASFALLGILGIGWEIENPFGFDDNDLPLDDFCKVIHKEIQTIIGRKIQGPESWMMSNDNHPFYPDSHSTATQLCAMSEPQVRRLLAKIAARVSGKQEGAPHTKGQVLIDVSKLSATTTAPSNGGAEGDSMLTRAKKATTTKKKY